jgi:hypothetical protein
VRDVGVGALELVEHLVKLGREGEVLVDQVMHGARLRRHGERRPHQRVSLVGDGAILQQVHRGDLDDRVDRRICPGGFDVDHADGHMGSRVWAKSGAWRPNLTAAHEASSSICDSRLGEQVAACRRPTPCRR